MGPFTSVGPRARVARSEVEYSLLEEEAVVEEVRLRLQECILGVRAEVKSRTASPGPPPHPRGPLPGELA
ncbi:hypothetical protein [Thermus parvatiensis]|uniref:hypothetical protein n=1 Tax=Thermus parvatiensis TaxID=456163 RepID=UPI001FD035D7|nr:hypothetical protein [Thermus parvatiensis]